MFDTQDRLRDAPFHRRGLRHARVVAATLGAATLAGSGAIVVALATGEAPAQAAGSGTTGVGTAGQGAAGALAPSTAEPGGTISQPRQAPAAGGSTGTVHASTGGS